MPVSLSGSILITGSLTTSGTITAQTLVVQTITSSILYSSGSNIFGNQLTNTQTFTGSINITGSQNIFGNVGTLAVFRVGAEDAEFLEREFSPQFTAEDLVNLPKYNIDNPCVNIGSPYIGTNL